MATFTTRLGIRKPAGTDLVTVTTDINASMDMLDTAIDRICTSSTRPSSPFLGERCYETDTKNYIVHNGTQWEHLSLPVVSALANILAPYLNQHVVLSTDGKIYRCTNTVGPVWTALGSVGLSTTQQSAPGNSGTYSGTTYTETRTGAGGTECQVALVAPPSGKVKISWSCGLTISNAAGFALMSWVFRTGSTLGSGTVVQAASDSVVCQNTGLTAENSFAQFFIMTGLTPGSSYNVCGAYRTTSGHTGTFNRPKILVEPVLS